MKNYTKSIGRGLAIASLAWSAQIQAATFLTFVDDQPGFMAAIGPGTTVTTEDFSTVVDGQLLGPQGSPDAWNGFTTEVYGTSPGLPWGPSKYCALLNSPTCIGWNSSTPAVPGIYGSVAEPSDGILFKLASPTIAAVSFDFVDWNDGSERSQLIATASDGSEAVVQGPINAPNAPAQTFGVTLSPADIAAGVYVTQIRWVGLVGGSEIVGFYDFKTYTNPVITNTPPVASPDTYPMPNGPIPLNLLVNDSDPDGDTLQITSINGVAVTPGVAQSIPVPSGTVNIAVDGAITFTPALNANGPTTFPYEISDGRGGTSNSTVTLTAKPVPPITAPTPVPSLDNWALVGLSVFIAIFGLNSRRRRS